MPLIGRPSGGKRKAKQSQAIQRGLNRTANHGLIMTSKQKRQKSDAASYLTASLLVRASESPDRAGQTGPDYQKPLHAQASHTDEPLLPNQNVD